MQTGVTCYKADMGRKPAEETKKKVVMVGVKVDEPTREMLGAVCGKEDRPLGYVVRELMLRGLAAYLRDGSLKEPPTETIRVPTYTLGEKIDKRKRA